MNRRINSIAIALAFFLILVIIYSATNQLKVPHEPSFNVPIYSGELWCIPDKYLVYVALEGALSEADFPMISRFYKSSNEKGTKIIFVKVLTLETSNGDKGASYYLVDCNDKPVFAVSGKYTELTGKPHLWVFGHLFRYRGPDNNTYTMLNPVEIHTKPVSNLVMEAEEVLVKEVGRTYFQKYFSSPLLCREFFDDLEWKYFVSYSYNIKVGDYRTTSQIYIYFNKDRKLISTKGVPLEDNRMPFDVTREEAFRIAVEAGLPSEPEPFEADIIYAENWGEDNKTLEFLGRYVWSVSVWIDDPEANPRHYMAAVIDPDTGRVYETRQGGVGYIMHISLGDVINPEHALKHNIPGYIEVKYVSEPPKLVIVSPGREVNLTIQLMLVSHIPEFNETEILLDPKQGTESGVGYVIFNDYIVYSPSGRMMLKLGEPLNVTMTLRVPEGFPGFSAKPQHLLGVGISADVYLVSEEHMQLIRIHEELI